MSKKTIIFYVLAVLFFFTVFSGGGVGPSIVSIALTALFGYLGYHSMKKPSVSPAPSSPVPASSPVSTPKEETLYEFIQVKLAGVTFKNGRKSRQSILRAIHFRDGEFENGIELELQPYEWEGQPAYGVYANGQQLGNIPADMVSFIHDNYQRIEGISNIEVYGGGRSSEGTPINYGCEITLKFHK